MTLPSLPILGSTNWYEWASSVHDAVEAGGGGGSDVFLNVKDYGATGDGTTDDTAAIQAAINDAKQGDGCQPVVFPPTENTNGYMFSQLLLNKGQILLGLNGMFGTRLKRITGSTGAAIREKTPGESGNGAQGITIKGITINCNNCVGDGISLGAVEPVAGKNWGFNGVIEDVCVMRAAGAGFRLVADAITGRNLSAYFNTDGVVLEGYGNNTWHGISTSQNTNTEITTSAVGDAFFGVHLEPQGTSAVVVTAGRNAFYGVTAFLKASITDLFKVSTSSGITLHSVTAVGDALTVTNMVTHTTTPAINLPATLVAGRYQFASWTDIGVGPAYWTSSVNGTVTQIGASSALTTTGMSTSRRTVTADAAVGASDGTVFTNGTLTVTLPAASAGIGRIIRVRNIHASATATIASAGGNIDGSATATLAAGAKATYQSEGNVWFTV